jgi:hypothetical protein
MDAEDAAMNPVQSPTGDPGTHPASAEAGLAQLGEGDQVKLPCGARGDGPIHTSIGRLRHSVSRAVPIAGHALMLNGSDARVALRM